MEERELLRLEEGKEREGGFEDERGQPLFAIDQTKLVAEFRGTEALITT